MDPITLHTRQPIILLGLFTDKKTENIDQDNISLLVTFKPYRLSI